MDESKNFGQGQAEQHQVEQQPTTTRRHRPVRAQTIPIKKMTKEQLKIGRMLYPIVDHNRPKLRAECQGAERPCPFVSCKHHLYLDVNPETGSIKLNFPDVEVWEMGETCALDIAERGGITLEEVGEIMNLTRERIRQLEMSGLTKLSENDGLNGSSLCEFSDFAWED
jgi:hypothetical protein